MLFLCLPVPNPANVQVLVSKGKLPRDKADKALSLLKGVLDYTEFRDVDMVIEVAHISIASYNLECNFQESMLNDK